MELRHRLAVALPLLAAERDALTEEKRDRVGNTLGEQEYEGVAVEQ